MRARGKEREKQCAYCERTFTKEEHLRRHERSHTGEKPFKCHKCSRKYGCSDVLARHLLTHPLDDIAHAQGLNSSSCNGAETSPRRPENIGQTSQDGTMVPKDQNMALPSEHDTLIISNQEQQQLFAVVSTTFPPPTHHQLPGKPSSLLPRTTTSDPSGSVSGSKAQPPISPSDRVETATTTRNADPMSWSTTAHEGTDDVSR
ncbi:uncharacterized protein A1O9_12221 [Exophiala aquamarina CBS 119918]|uniref:C2H2-type domain-containing protein n=1 Tax=Exophiala aquamarina CBS 119918 TaxID=1182545 RepID=A0A072NVE0_9EURO|nr:uncharacterized protein A1O9_12221 [Exophiala aquamarina CBS 119918]KEF51586.1 hypothetical protein A1O9_12221 [Exophiala aquamarina CBS 119918]